MWRFIPTVLVSMYDLPLVCSQPDEQSQPLAGALGRQDHIPTAELPRSMGRRAISGAQNSGDEDRDLENVSSLGKVMKNKHLKSWRQPSPGCAIRLTTAVAHGQRLTTTRLDTRVDQLRNFIRATLGWGRGQSLIGSVALSRGDTFHQALAERRRVEDRGRRGGGWAGVWTGKWADILVHGVLFRQWDSTFW